MGFDIKDVLRHLTSKIGVSGDEYDASAAAAELLSQYAENVSTDAFGNVTGYISSDRPDAATLMLDAHIDRIGLVVTYIDDEGFVKAGCCGGVDMKPLLAQSVTIHGREDVRGVVCTLPPHVSSDRTKAPEITDISIDIGMTHEQAQSVISLGDRITINSCFAELCGSAVSSAALDDRSGVCAVLAALDMLDGKAPAYNLAICFSAQEETGEQGVKQAAFRIRPDEAIVVDVSFGRTPDSSPKETAELGSGVMIGFSAALDKGMSHSLRRLAQRCGIAHTIEAMPSSTGTNADSIAVSCGGVRCCTLSFPIRYMHTPVETADIRDIEATAKLICEYALGGTENA